MKKMLLGMAAIGVIGSVIAFAEVKKVGEVIGESPDELNASVHIVVPYAFYKKYREDHVAMIPVHKQITKPTRYGDKVDGQWSLNLGNEQKYNHEQGRVAASSCRLMYKKNEPIEYTGEFGSYRAMTAGNTVRFYNFTGYFLTCEVNLNHATLQEYGRKKDFFDFSQVPVWTELSLPVYTEDITKMKNGKVTLKGTIGIDHGGLALYQ